MAITITKNPTSPNLANNTIVYAVTSNKDAEPQFKFVLDINDKDGNLLQRLKQQPNTQGTGIFNISQVITNYLGPTDNVWKVFIPTANTASGKDFRIRFGEEYATTATSSTFITTGVGSPSVGTPAASSSFYDFYIDGVVDINGDKVDYNWNSGSKYDEESTDGSTIFTHQNGLTSFDTQSVRLGDYATISYLRGNLNGITGSAVNSSSAQDIYAAIYRQYDATGSLLTSDTLYDTFSGLRTANTQLWDSVYLSQSEATRLVHWPAGPQNIEDAGVTLDANLSYYTITFYNQNLDPGINDSGVYGEYRFNIDTGNCDYPGVRFAWKNEYGVWDYFNFTLAESTNSGIEREQFKQSFVDYGALLPSADTTRRGFQQFQNRINKTRTAQSDYLNQTDADNIRELFFSTNVYVQDGSDFYPVVIEDASVTEKTNPRSQKLFTYTVTYRYANDTEARV